MKLIDGNDTEASDIYSVFDNRDASQEARLKQFVISGVERELPSTGSQVADSGRPSDMEVSCE
jgi:hypothetical protein